MLLILTLCVFRHTLTVLAGWLSLIQYCMSLLWTHYYRIRNIHLWKIGSQIISRSWSSEIISSHRQRTIDETGFHIGLPEWFFRLRSLWKLIWSPHSSEPHSEELGCKLSILMMSLKTVNMHDEYECVKFKILPIELELVLLIYTFILCR